MSISFSKVDGSRQVSLQDPGALPEPGRPASENEDTLHIKEALYEPDLQRQEGAR